MRKIRLHWSVHPEKDAAWYEAQKRRMTPDEVARELDIQYVLSVSGKVFSVFRSHRHVVREVMPYNQQLPVYRIFDFGKTNCTLYAQVDGHGRVRLLHERVLTNSTTTEQVAVAEQDSLALFWRAEFIDVCDPAGSVSSHNAPPDMEQLYEAFGQYPEYEAIYRLPSRERKQTGIKLLQQVMQQTPGGEEGLLIYAPVEGAQGCPVLVEALEGGYCYRQDATGQMLDQVDERHPYEDVVDCLLYLMLVVQAGGVQVEADGFEPVANEIDPFG